MSAIENLQPGLRGHAELVVGEQHTALFVGSGDVEVLATPVMIMLMEAASINTLRDALPAGCTSVGTHLQIDHIAPTPRGMRVRAYAHLISVEGRNLTFEVFAEDDRERIGAGIHRRSVVDLERFTQHASKKKNET